MDKIKHTETRTAELSKTDCQTIGVAAVKIIDRNLSKKGAVITNNQDSSIYIGFDNGVTKECFVFHLRPVIKPNQPQDYIIIEQGEYIGEVWAVADIAPNSGTVNTTIIL